MFSLFGRSRSLDTINEIPDRLKSDPAARVIDVRTEAEYRLGHIPGSLSVPLGHLERIQLLCSDRSAPLLVYCQSGARSAQAVYELHRLGYARAENMGGLIGWDGPLEKGS